MTNHLQLSYRVKTILPEIMTLSLPPQGTAVKIIVESTDAYIEETIDENNEDLKYPVIVGLEEEMEKEINPKIEEYINEHFYI